MNKQNEDWILSLFACDSVKKIEVRKYISILIYFCPFYFYHYLSYDSCQVTWLGRFFETIVSKLCFSSTGMNPIVLYMGHEVLHRHFPISWEVSQYHYSLLSMDLWGTVFWVLVGLVLYKKRIFITVWPSVNYMKFSCILIFLHYKTWYCAKITG